MCAARGSALERATRDAVVAFEADQVTLDEGEARGWSVVVTGVARWASEHEAQVVAEHPLLAQWMAPRASRVVSMSCDLMSGRRFRV